jgi:molybdenum cofactor biosynthesis protein B
MSQQEQPKLTVAILVVSDTRTLSTDTSGALCERMLGEAGHDVIERVIVPDDPAEVRRTVAGWVDQFVDVVVVTGGTGITGRDITVEALQPLVSKDIPGFGELFRWLSYADIGAATIQSRAFAALCQATLLFALPGSSGAVRLALEKIIVPQLDAGTKPCNFAMLMPRLREK